MPVAQATFLTLTTASGCNLTLTPPASQGELRAEAAPAGPTATQHLGEQWLRRTLNHDR